ncbi:MAG TPA: hypothetical protein VF549_15080 [Solirubrobacteraceae bacterium]
MPRLGLLLLMLASMVGGVAAASAVTSDDAPVHPNPTSEDLEPDGFPPAVHALADDPDGGPRWGVRVYRGTTGMTCANAGRVEDGRFGRVDAAGDHVPLPAAADGACADLGTAGLAFAAQRYPARPGQAERAVVFGVATDAVREVVLRTPAGDRPLRRARDGAFLGVEPSADVADLALVVTTTEGETRTYPLAA